MSSLIQFVITTLEDTKAQNVQQFDVTTLSSITDTMIIASGTSNRHVRSLADNLASEAKKHNIQVLGVEGDKNSEWVLVDLGDVVVHVMQNDTRNFYQLEKLWSAPQPTSLAS